MDNISENLVENNVSLDNLDTLLDGLKNDPNHSNRRNYAMALGNYGNQALYESTSQSSSVITGQIVPALIDSINTEDSNWVKLACVSALSNYSDSKLYESDVQRIKTLDEQIVPTLISTVNSVDLSDRNAEEVAMIAVLSLAKLQYHSDTVYDFLKGIVERADQVHKEVSSAYEELEGEEIRKKIHEVTTKNRFSSLVKHAAEHALYLLSPKEFSQYAHSDHFLDPRM